MEDSGLRIKDVLMWLYGQGMPKSQNIGKKDPAWEGWGTGLKPCYEPILLAQKPIEEKTIVKNCQKYGVGGINIEDTRLESGRWPGNVLHDGSEEVEEQFAEFGDRGNGWSRNYGVEDYQGSMAVEFLVEVDILVKPLTVILELLVGSSTLLKVLSKKELTIEPLRMIIPL